MKSFPSVILCDDILEVFIGYGCGRTKDGIGNVLDKCPGYDDLTLTGFVMEEFSQRRNQKAKKGFLWINMVEVRKKITCLLDGVCEVQDNFIIFFKSNQGVIIEVQVEKEGKNLGKVKEILCQEGGYQIWCFPL